ncbi:protein timeless-like [Ylistrum balloti]|uniref:protein timeless-like n=1 Tax=Ylistrum balloti TaxID=509963 RepID=UPI0029059FAE|nr:protein timeless-like [Ylistrum balloti]
MEWHIMNVDGINSLSSNLGMVEDGVYIPSSNSQAILEENLEFLMRDNMDKTYRRLLFNNKFPEKELVPLIKYIRDDHTNLQEALRLMILLTNPVEYDYDTNERTKPPWAIELESAIKDTVEKCFCKTFVTAIVEEMKLLLEESGPYSLTDDGVAAINKCLFMIRNLLYIKESSPDQSTIMQHVERVKLLFDCGYEEVLISLLQKKEVRKWSNGLMQVNWLIYKGKLDMLFSNDFDKMNWEPMLECLPVEGGRMSDIDGSEAGALNHVFTNTCNILDGKDDGKQMQQDTSDECDDSSIYIKSSMSLLTPNVISEFRFRLRLFTTKILSNGFMVVFANILEQFKTKDNVLDEAYLFWELALFMRFAKTKKLPLKCVKHVLTEDMVGYLVYQCFIRAEEVFVHKSSQKKEPQKLKLSLCALREILEFLYNLQQESPEDQDEEEKEYVHHFHKKLASMTDLPNLLLYMIRHCIVELLGMSFLEDLVLTNHLLLYFLDCWINSGLCQNSFVMLSHIKNFATYGIMEKYGLLLEHFLNNSVEVNNCVLTMMHHVAGQCGSPHVLLQKPILDTFLEINDQDIFVSDEVDDLIEFIIRKFIATAEEDPYQCAVNMFSKPDGSGCDNPDMEMTTSKASVKVEWSSEDDDILIMVYMEAECKSKVVEDILRHFKELDMEKTTEQIVCKLIDSEWMEEEEKAKILAAYPECKLQPIDKTSVASPDITSCAKKRKHDSEKDWIPTCVQRLQDSGLGNGISWLQGLLCEAAYVKLNHDYLPEEATQEPITKFHILCNKSIPLVSFTEEQISFLRNKLFCILLENLGILMPENVSCQHPRIPQIWSPKHLFDTAQKLGSLDEVSLKFDKLIISKMQDEDFYNLPEADDVITRKSPKRNDFDSFKYVFESNGLLWTDLIQNFNKV